MEELENLNEIDEIILKNVIKMGEDNKSIKAKALKSIDRYSSSTPSYMCNSNIVYLSDKEFDEVVRKLDFTNNAGFDTIMYGDIIFKKFNIEKD